MEDEGKYLAEIIEAVERELDERLVAELSVQDRLAIGTALRKAARRGYLSGIAACAYEASANWREMVERLRPLLPAHVPAVATELNVHLVGADGQELGPEADDWAKLYGD